MLQGLYCAFDLELLTNYKLFWWVVSKKSCDDFSFHILYVYLPCSVEVSDKMQTKYWVDKPGQNVLTKSMNFDGCEDVASVSCLPSACPSVGWVGHQGLHSYYVVCAMMLCTWSRYSVSEPAAWSTSKELGGSSGNHLWCFGSLETWRRAGRRPGALRGTG